MFQHIVDQYMNDNIRLKLDRDAKYYQNRYYDTVGFIKAVENNDIEEVKNYLIIGGIDIDTRIRFDFIKRSEDDITALKIALLAYHLDMAKLLLDMGADTDITILFNGSDHDSQNAEGLRNAIDFCEENNIYYKIV